MVNFKEKPFYLNDEQIEWVEKTYSSMTFDERVGQMFCHIAYESNDEYLQGVLNTLKPGGIMLRPMPLEETVSAVSCLQKSSNIPMLIAANLEKGGSGAIKEGTNYASPMEIAATNDPEYARRLGEICGAEGAAAGLNWAFAPIIDIDYNFRNPITNTRTFGSDPKRVMAMGEAYVEAVQSHGVAASIKHFPGDGCDERDQHLVASINDLSCEEWDKTYGEIYKSCIDKGAKTVMIGHIMQPAYTRKLNPEIADKDMQPASVSRELVTGLLKEKLGFNGLVVTDATTMAGMVINMPREKAVPMTIAAGCDMFLFCRNLEEDLGYMKKGIEDGTIAPERFEEAVKKVLALKASLNLPEKKAEGTLIPSLESAAANIGTEKHKAWASECADKAVTLVKEEPGVLPINSKKYPRVLFYPIESDAGVMYSVETGVAGKFVKKLEDNGFKVTVYQPTKGLEGMMTSQAEFLEEYDSIIYLANMATKSNQTTVRIEWAQPMGANVPIYMTRIPTVFVSVENPYHLLDVPRVRTFINAYHSNDETLNAIIEKLMGNSVFKGTNPVDPFCGKWDTKLQ